jgi:CheY-like chemotaxis protein
MTGETDTKVLWTPVAEPSMLSLRATSALTFCPREANGIPPLAFSGSPDEPRDGVNRKRLVVSLVDDSESIRESLPDLLRHAGFDPQTFPSAEAFIASSMASETACLILDVGLPGMSGPELHLELARRGIHIPTIFITAQRDRIVGERLVAQGAIACLFKPFGDAALLDAVTAAVK